MKFLILAARHRFDKLKKIQHIVYLYTELFSLNDNRYLINGK
jgi:hypothetical protein